MTLNMKRNMPFGLYLGFHGRDFHENTHGAPDTFSTSDASVVEIDR
jgi:hypothetical protein